MKDETRADRRQGERTPVRVPVKVRHEGTEYPGLTRDLSSSGVFLYSDTGLKPGSKLELVIMLPPGIGLGSGGWTLCEASVVRVEERVEQRGEGQVEKRVEGQVEDSMAGGVGQSHGKRIGIAATLDRIALLPELS
jgi:hypothetical protein